jgi:alcohol dehydrogenase class IV
MNIEALRARAPGSPALRRYGEIAGALGAEPDAPEGAVRQLAALRRSLGIPLLSSFGLKAEDVPSIVAASRAGSMKYNPVELTDAELGRILFAVLAGPSA